MLISPRASSAPHARSLKPLILAVSGPVASMALGLIAALTYIPAGTTIVPSLATAFVQLAVLVAAIVASLITAAPALRTPRRAGWPLWAALGVDAAALVTCVLPLVLAITSMTAEGYFG